jgi:hypothetical protein
MTSAQLEAIRQFDARCGDNEGVLFPVTIDRRRLIEYVDELKSLVREARGHLDHRHVDAEQERWLEKARIVE